MFVPRFGDGRFNDKKVSAATFLTDGLICGSRDMTRLRIRNILAKHVSLTFYVYLRNKLIKRKHRMENTFSDIPALLRQMADEPYKAFQGSLIPTVPQERIIGVRTPQLRALAREMLRNGMAQDYLAHPLPCRTFDEMQLRAFIVSGLKNFEEALAQTELLLPHIDNWATCDQLSPTVFSKHTELLLPSIGRWLEDRHEYTVRFGISMLMRHYLDAPRFRPEYLETVCAVHREEYYVRMMQAWYFATALAKQYSAALPYLVQRRLDPWTHRKTIQKACESLRLSPEQKAELRRIR